MIKQINDYKEFKRLFLIKFKNTLKNSPEFEQFIYKLLTYNVAYIVGGYLRDIINKSSRDVDIITSADKDTLVNQIKSHNLNYKVNRHNGIKIILNGLEVDIWNINDNWAFRNKVVKFKTLNSVSDIEDKKLLEKIANGCFYNYDSIVLNIQTLNLHAQNYNKLAKSNKLDILQKHYLYQKRNHTIEANILRAFYLHIKFNIDFSDNCNRYIKLMLAKIKDEGKDPQQKLGKYLIQYPKYADYLNEANINNLIIKFTQRTNSPQKSFDF